jgi:3-methyl-2-oxobutanoate hydroxymethyltransferase
VPKQLAAARGGGGGLLLTHGRPRSFATLAPDGELKKSLDQEDAPLLPLYGADAGTTAPTASEASPRKPVTVTTLRGKHRRGERISMLTAYDYPSARLAEQAGLDILLVGDSVGMVVLGYDSTTPVTMGEMLHHCKAVARGSDRCFKVGDLPFGSYLTAEDALRNSVALIKDGKMDAVKLEGGRRVVPQIRAVVDAGVNVMGHVGLTPQTAAALGGYRVQGKSAAAAEELLADAIALEEAGCIAVVLECVPDRIADYVTSRLSVPTIGIGAGAGCSGQVQVLHDVLGLYDKLQPKFSRQYVDAGSIIASALESYVADVSNSSFPGQKESFTIVDKQYDDFIAGQIAKERETNDAAEGAAMRGAQIAELQAKQRRLVAEVERMKAQADLASLEQQVAELQAQLSQATDPPDNGVHRSDPSRTQPRLLKVTA